MSTTSNIAKGGYKVENNDNLFSVPTGSSRKRRRANENQTQTQAFAKAELARVKASIHYTHNSTTLPPSTKSTTNATSNTKNKNRVNQSGNSNYANHLDKKLNAKVSLHEQKRLKAAKFAMDSEILNTETNGYIETETYLEKTYKLTQASLRPHLDIQSQKQIYDLDLTDFSPYTVSYSRSGRGMILAGTSGGHVAVMDALAVKLKSEVHLREKIHDSCFLHNETLFAIAQNEHAYIYDDQGVEIHRMDQHVNPYQLQFLPHHWLLASVGRAGWLKYHDTSTGNLVSQHRSKLGPCAVMNQNPHNSVIHLGHGNGTVTLWSPASSEPLVKMLCHRGPITALANDATGHYMATGGSDGQVKVWDLRSFKLLHSYYSKTPVTCLDVSQTGMLGWGAGSKATFWKDALTMKAKDPYMTHSLNGRNVASLTFRPYEDVCGLGHGGGFSSIVVPGAGEANYDALTVNMFQDKKQRQESEVRSLLDKLSPNMIALNPDVVGTVERDRAALIKEQRDIAQNADIKSQGKQKKKARGRNKISKKLARKSKNIVEQKTENLKKLRDISVQENMLRKEQEGGGGGGEEGEGKIDIAAAISNKEKPTGALKRFF